MKVTDEQSTPPTGEPLFVTDRKLAPLIGVSVGFLQKDRREAQRIPFIRLGDRCLYDVNEALAAIKALTVGGNRSRRQRGAGVAQ
jgi:hypothetical protein